MNDDRLGCRLGSYELGQDLVVTYGKSDGISFKLLLKGLPA